MVYKDSILLKIIKTNKRFKDIDFSEIQLEKKISVLIDMGFFYNPYSKEFVNLYTDSTIKSDFLLHTNLNHLIELYKNHFNDYIFKNHKIKTEFEIDSLFRKKENFLMSNLYTFSGIYGILGIVTLFFFFFLNLDDKTLFINSLFNFLLIHFYFVKNHSVVNFENQTEVSQFWRKTELLFLILEIFTICTFYFFTSRLLNNYWIPIISTLVIREVYSLLIDRYLSTRYNEWNYNYIFLKNTNKIESINDFENIDIY